jgi:hypothetical protein
VNIVSRLLTILCGMSCNLNMFFMNAFATIAVVYGCVIGMKLLYLAELVYYHYDYIISFGQR